MDHLYDQFCLENESDLNISSDDELVESLIQSHCKLPFNDFCGHNNDEYALEFPEAFNIRVDIIDN